jgi:phosphoribosylamine--glycine ligase
MLGIYQMQILIIGSGGREHALAWKVAQSPQVNTVFVAPGNGGTALENKVKNVDIAANDIAGLMAFALENQIDFTLVGPEKPLEAGIVDSFTAAGQRCFGPSQAASQLESSKTFAKEFLQRHNIPTAKYASFTDLNAALAYQEGQPLPLVIKADGLAAGKGVIIAYDRVTAIKTLENMLKDNSFGSAGHRVVIEEFLVGEEASFIVMADSLHVLPLATSQDHKTLYDGDTGPNTGGMGAYSPAPVITPALHQRIMAEIINPTIAGMANEGHPYTGFLYAGLMISPSGNPFVIEYNCRLGDPETQPLMLRLQSDLVLLCLAAFEQRLDQVKAAWDTRPALGVVLTSEGYPDNTAQGAVITGLPSNETSSQKLFHAGTRLDHNIIVTAGGRVLCATALGDTIGAAQTNAYALAEQLRWPGVYYRTDIGYRAVDRDSSSR